MFDLGWSEMVVIGVAALVVVGPKELPNLFRTVGVVMGKARGMAREFTKAMEDAADQSGMRDIDRTIRAATRPMEFGKTAIRSAALGTATGAAGNATAAPSAPAPAAAPLALGPETAALAEKQAAARQARAASVSAATVAPAAPAPEPLAPETQAAGSMP